MSSQSIMDRVVAAKHSIAGQGLAKSVCKATTEEIIGPKKKHLDYLLQCTNEPNVSIPQMADLLIERTSHASWVVVYKSLITIHNLMNYGNERFTQYLASNNCSFNLGAFVDKGGVQGYDMSTFIRRYAKYLNEKAVSYRNMAFDFCKVKRGKDDGLLRTMNTEKLLKALPILQQQLDALLEFDCTPNELTNGVINACFMLLFKDLIRLFACYNDGIINLLEKYFDMNKKQCKEALDIYKRFLVRMDKVSEFLKVAESVGIDKGDIPDLAKGLRSGSGTAPASLLDALEQHLASLEGKKGTTPTSTSAAKPSGFASALNTISNNSNTFNVSDEEKKKILDEENQRLQQLKQESMSSANEQRLKELGQDVQSPSGSGSGMAAASNPFGGGAPAKQPSVDLFDAGSPTAATSPPPAASSAAAAGVRPSDDLLNLTGNPFIQNVQTVMASAYPAQQQPPAAMAATNPFGQPSWQNGSATGTFTSDADFASAFNTSTATGFDAFGEVLQPVSKQPAAVGGAKPSQEKLIKGDLDTSLVQLAGNLNINGPGSQMKKTDHQWKPKNDSKLTGGTTWQRPPGPTASSTSPLPWQPASTFAQQPMATGMQGPRPAYQTSPMGMQMGIGQQPMMGIGARPMGMGAMPMAGQPMYGASMAGMQQPMAGMQQPRPTMPQQQPANVNDPFGAL